MPESDEFDALYAGCRRRLVLQTLALTGDPTAARSAVRDAFVRARQHWRTVSRRTDPEDWVRPHAWSIAQRRHVAHVGRRVKGLDEGQRAVLAALGGLSDVQRKTLILTHLATLPLEAIGRELGQTRQRTEQHLQTATAACAVALDCDSAALRAKLESLAPVANAVALPRAQAVRRAGVRRRRLHALGAVVLAAALTLGSGALVLAPASSSTDAGAPAVPVTRAMLLGVSDVAPLDPQRTWSVRGTDDNTAGTGINSVCQTSRFADPKGLRTLVRTLADQGATGTRRVVQTVEMSTTPGDAQKAYATTVGWYAGCQTARVQLVNSYAVGGLGEQAQALALRLPGVRHTYVVAVARVGALTVTTLVDSSGVRAPHVSATVGLLSTAVGRLCGTTAAGGCSAATSAAATPTVQRQLPPPSGETPGMLAVADLPQVAGVGQLWVGTAAQTSSFNPAATPCDQADFTAAGATTTKTRSYLIPKADLPARFGIAETYGEFPSATDAATFTATVGKRLAGCHKRDLGATVSDAYAEPHGFRGSTLASWRVETQINKDEQKVGYWMGITRVGKYVAQVSFAPTAGHDLDEATLRALLSRARDRLLELS